MVFSCVLQESGLGFVRCGAGGGLTPVSHLASWRPHGELLPNKR
jgi:hypothetical protein